MSGTGQAVAISSSYSSTEGSTMPAGRIGSLYNLFAGRRETVRSAGGIGCVCHQTEGDGALFLLY